MPNSDTKDPDHQAAQMAAYSLRAAGWTVDLLVVDASGARISAHRGSQKGNFLESPSYKDLER